MILPMLAKPLPEGFKVVPGKYAAEEKYNGWRLLCEVIDGQVKLHSRSGKDHAIIKRVSAELMRQLGTLPNCYLDGELVMDGADGSKHYSVADLSNTSKLRYVVFDILSYDGEMQTHKSFAVRRTMLGLLEEQMRCSLISIAPCTMVGSTEELFEMAHEVWRRKGEGLIVKDLTLSYSPGKRTHAFYKLKEWNNVIAEIVGFQPTKGEIMDRGACAITVARDAEGNLIHLKTLDDETCAMLEKDPESFIGRRLLIEYTSRTPTGLYENAMWDRLAEGGE